MVLEHAGARRAGALATSLMAQIAAAGVLSFVGLLALVRSIEASRPFASISILEAIERDAAVRAARMRALSADGGVKPLEAALTQRHRAA